MSDFVIETDNSRINADWIKYGKEKKALKHLQGLHNQKKHGARGGAKVSQGALAQKSEIGSASALSESESMSLYQAESKYNAPTKGIMAMGRINRRTEEIIRSQTANELSKVSGEQAPVIERLCQEWNETSNGSYQAIMTQKAAEAEFGSKMSDWQNKLEAKATAVHNSHPNDHLNYGSSRQVETDEPETPQETVDYTRKVLRAMYDRTQAEFAKEGIKEVDLYRGLTIDADSPAGKAIQAWMDGGRKGAMNASLISNALESWTSDPGVARRFMNPGENRSGMTHGGKRSLAITIGAKVPVSKILSNANTGFGTFYECEVAVLKSIDDICTVLEVKVIS